MRLYGVSSLHTSSYYVNLVLATVIDLFSRKIIGYSMSNRMAKDFIINALLVALKKRNYPKNVISGANYYFL